MTVLLDGETPIKKSVTVTLPEALTVVLEPFAVTLALFPNVPTVVGVRTTFTVAGAVVPGASVPMTQVSTLFTG